MDDNAQDAAATTSRPLLTACVFFVVSTVLAGGAVYGYRALGERFVPGLEERQGEVVFKRAQGLAFSGENEKALETFARAVSLPFDNPKDRAWCWQEFGALLSKQRRFKDAAKALRTSIEFYEKDPEAHELLCIALQHEDRFEEMAIVAMHWFSHSATKEHMGEAKFNLGLALENQGLVDEALVAYLDGHRLNPMSHNSFHAARILESKGHEEKAFELFKAFLQDGVGWRVAVAKDRYDALQRKRPK